ncbi:hypothetical protein ACFL4A_05035 [bacterium]
MKFLMAIGALKGAGFTFYGALYGIILAGTYVLIFLIKKKRLNNFLSTFANLFLLKFNASKNDDTIPYGVFLAIGILLRLVLIEFNCF